MKLTKQLLKNLIRETIKETKMNLVEAQMNANFAQVLDVLRGNTSVRTVGIMSGQNPMATAISARRNTELNQQLKSRLDSMNLDYKTVGGIFEKIKERSVIIMNPTMRQMEELNAEFRQWGFVYGKRIGDRMEFTMQKMHTPSIDSEADPELASLERSHYEAGDLGSEMPSDSNYASEIHTDMSNRKAAGRSDNITLIDGHPIVIPLYKGYGDPTMKDLTDPDKFHADTPRRTRMRERKKKR
jgi:hypothetical protein